MITATQAPASIDGKRARAFGLRSPAAPITNPTAVPAETIEHRCSLRLRIDGVTYRVRPVASQAFGVIKAFGLKRVGAETHTIAETIEGHACDCGDFVWRRDGRGTPCKHLAAARACGLL